MNFNWIDYLTLAETLVKAADKESATLKEAKYRAAISRAYYAAFCKAHNFLRDTYSLQIPIRDPHNFVINQFLDANDQDQKVIGEKLHTLRTKRNKADYQDRFKGTLAIETYQSLRLAQEIVAFLDSLQP
jgi:uncharacterized protein (UPF0332 family)